jgi:hypothetical protein
LGYILGDFLQTNPVTPIQSNADRSLPNNQDDQMSLSKMAKNEAQYIFVEIDP